jgi:hypothetical protein
LWRGKKEHLWKEAGALGFLGGKTRRRVGASVYITYSVFFFLNQQRSFFFQFFMAVLVS